MQYMIKAFISKLLIVLVFASLLFAGCHEKIDWDSPPFESKPVMNSILIPGKPVKVHVSLAVPYGANKSILVEDAEVNLFVDGVFTETLVYTEKGIYHSQLVAEIGKEYVCHVHVDDYPVARGSTTIPTPVNILGVEHINVAGVDEEGTKYPAVKITFENRPGIFTCHEVVIANFNSYWNEWDRAGLMDFVDPVLLNEGLPLTIFSNEIIKDESYTMTINYTTGITSGKLLPLRIELRTVSHSYYQFTRQVYLYEYNNEDYVFSGVVRTPFTIHSNVENGYGIFTSYSSVTSSIIYPEE
jgi:hypothetical protein